MRKLLIIIGLLLTIPALQAQPVFKVIVPQTSVPVGQPFTVQYIMEASGAASFSLPDLPGFTVVNGPDEYTSGNNLVNQVYTLVGRREGKNMLPAASITVKGKTYYTPQSYIDILPVESLSPRGAQPATETLSLLLPGEDPYQKIKDNIVVKVEVSTRQCRVGEPVVATYKIYSSLSSVSEIIKNPVFYGFAAVDIINLDTPITGYETFRGKKYTVHTVRKVQLYPTQAGKFSIDAMDVLHKVTFDQTNLPQTGSGGATPAKTTAGKEIMYESRSASEPVTIQVLPLPETNRPDTFVMAAGRFMITASINKNTLAKNETCLLSVVLSGKGNIIQIAPPVIDWPQQLESFEPAMRDSLNREQVPITGTRTFLYHFLSPEAGSFTLPAITFTYFDTDSNRYKTLRTKPVSVLVEDREFVAETQALQKGGVIKAASRSTWLFTGVLLLLGIAIGVMWWTGKKEKKAIATKKATAHIKTVEELLAPAQASWEQNDNHFYVLLRKGIYDYLAQYLQQPVSGSTKQSLRSMLMARQVSTDKTDKLFFIIEQCEHGAFTMAALQNNKEQLLQETTDVLKKL